MAKFKVGGVLLNKNNGLFEVISIRTNYYGVVFLGTKTSLRLSQGYVDDTFVLQVDYIRKKQVDKETKEWLND